MEEGLDMLPLTGMWKGIAAMQCILHYITRLKRPRSQHNSWDGERGVG
jgi:hypothetical protein